ncbi:MAG: MarC family protein [Chitinophagales bacterium]|nr:MarC family protein [Chitinophagales bacterium]MDW8393154.1 MarC family protein [Chitinophagales bacterium]
MITLNGVLSVALTLFLVIDVMGNVPYILNIRQKTGPLNPTAIVLFSALLLLLFTFFGESLLRLLGIDVSSFALAGSVVLLLLALEMILGISIFQIEGSERSGGIVPVAFPLLVGVGTLTTVIALRTQHRLGDLLGGIAINLLIIYVVLLALDWLDRKLGPQVLIVLKKFFGILLLAIAVQLFRTYA